MRFACCLSPPRILIGDSENLAEYLGCAIYGGLIHYFITKIVTHSLLFSSRGERASSSIIDGVSQPSSILREKLAKSGLTCLNFSQNLMVLAESLLKTEVLERSERAMSLMPIRFGRILESY